MSKNFEKRLLEALGNMHSEQIRTNMLIGLLIGRGGQSCSSEELEKAMIDIAVTANKAAVAAMKDLLERWKEEPDVG